MTFTRLFALAADASPQSVAACIADIKRTYSNVVNDAPEEDDSDTDGAAAATGNTDASGLPWDERIHASTKTIKKDGTWTKRKGVADALVTKVEAELRAGIAAPAAVVAPQAPVNPVVAVAGPTVPTLAVTTPVVVAPVTKYQSLVQWVARNTAPSPIPGQQLDPSFIEATLQQNGITGGLAAIATNEDFCGALEAALSGAITAAGGTPR